MTILVFEVHSIMAPIMDAISYLHNQQPPIIHRDIKPANIIVPPSGNDAVLVDFGIAKEFNPNSTTTAVRHASPGYAAPEQYGIGIATVAHKPTPKSTPVLTPVITPTPGVTGTQVVTQPSTPIQAGYPGVTGTYNGTIIDALGPIRGNMSLIIRQQQANIRGNFTVSGSLTGSGPFSGYVTNKNYIQFIVQSRDVNPLFFNGTVQANGDLGGNYCSLDATGRCNSNVGGYGTWGVVQSSPSSGS